MGNVEHVSRLPLKNGTIGNNGSPSQGNRNPSGIYLGECGEHCLGVMHLYCLNK